MIEEMRGNTLRKREKKEFLKISFGEGALDFKSKRPRNKMCEERKKWEESFFVAKNLWKKERKKAGAAL